MNMTFAAIAAGTCAAGVVMLAAAGQSARPPVRAAISEVAWISGSWAGEAPGMTLDERWTPPAGGAMLAVSRTIKANRMIAFEYLRIVEKDGGLVYIAQPEGRAATEFALTAVSATSATFENRGHDFPKVIRYTRRDDGGLEARVSDGGTKVETFVFRRMP
jgi:hypothetical protein